MAWSEKQNKAIQKLLKRKSRVSIEQRYRVTAEELRQFVERIERLDAEKKELAELQKEVMEEAKGRGYDTTVMRKLIAMRKRDAQDLAEEQAVLDMYLEAIGMA